MAALHLSIAGRRPLAVLKWTRESGVLGEGVQRVSSPCKLVMSVLLLSCNSLCPTLCWGCCLLCSVDASATTCHARASGARSLLYSCRRSARARSGGSETPSCTKGRCASFQGGCQRTHSLRGCPATICSPPTGSYLESLMVSHALLPALPAIRSSSRALRFLGATEN